MFTHRSLKKHLLVLVAAGSICLTAGIAVGDCDCCNHARVVLPPSAPDCSSCSSGCSSCGSCGIKDNCLFKAIDAVSAGIDKLLHVKKSGCDDKLCDDACDAGLIQELMQPAPRKQTCPHCPHHHAHGVPVPPPYSGPTQNVQITPTGPSQFEGAGRMRMTEPTIEPLRDEGQHLGGDIIMEPIETEVPPPVRLPETAPRTEPRDSIFDNLTDPFSDDEARLEPLPLIQPSSYEEIYLRPISKKPLSHSQMRSSRRQKSDR